MDDPTYRMGLDYGFSYRRVNVINKEFKRRQKLMRDPLVDNKLMKKSQAKQM